jgi:hypothetical protein
VMQPRAECAVLGATRRTPTYPPPSPTNISLSVHALDATIASTPHSTLFRKMYSKLQLERAKYSHTVSRLPFAPLHLLSVSFIPVFSKRCQHSLTPSNVRRSLPTISTKARKSPASQVLPSFAFTADNQFDPNTFAVDDAHVPWSVDFPA